jgi:magnesium transporter
MLNCFVPEPQGLSRLEPPPAAIPEHCLWVDLLEPTLEEEQAVERFLAVDVPTHEEMREIETSNRLYEENGALYMTATVVARIDTDRPETAAVTFILARNKLITKRYHDTLPFRRYSAHVQRQSGVPASAAAVLAGLLESVIERSADILERVGADLDETSAGIFAQRHNGTSVSRDMRAVMQRIGRSGDLVSKTRESLVSLGRFLSFVQQSAALVLAQDLRARFRTLTRDVTALSDHASFLNTKTSFLLEATLGLINSEQNDIIKIFSVAAVVFLPPTLIASIYGMNFHFIPELSWPVGYPLALLTMVASAVLPYWFFKRRGWL